MFIVWLVIFYFLFLILDMTIAIVLFVMIDPLLLITGNFTIALVREL